MELRVTRAAKVLANTLILALLIPAFVALLAGCKTSSPAPSDSTAPNANASNRGSDTDHARDQAARLEAQLKQGALAQPAPQPVKSERPAANGKSPIAHPHEGEAPAQPAEAPVAEAPAAEHPKAEAPPTDDLLARAEADRRVRQELSQKYLATGKKLYLESNLPQARENFAHAARLDPDNTEATRLLAEVDMALGNQAAEIKTVKEHYQDRLAVQIQQVTMEVNNHLAQGKRLFDAGKYKEAIVEFEAVEEKLRWNPYDIGLNEQRDKAHEWLRLAQERLDVQMRENDRLQKEAAVRIAQGEEEARRQSVRDRIKSLFKQALVNMDEKKYQRAEDLCNEILQIDPKFVMAKDLKEDALRARHRKAYRDFLREKIERWKRTIEDIDEALIPYDEGRLVRYPDMQRWQEKSKREKLGQIEEVKEIDPAILAIQNKLDTLKIDLDFTDANLYDILDFIREFAKINIDIAPEVKSEGIADKTITFQMKGLPLKNVLKLLLRQYSLDYNFDNQVLVVTKPELAEGKPVLEVHDVRDLLRTIPDFPGPDIQIALGTEEGVSAAFAESEQKSAITAEALQDLIKGNIAPTSWEERGDQVSIALTGNGQLLVVHTPAVQGEIRKFLSNLRSFTGAMVSIEARFVAVTDDFLQDIGVEFRGGAEPDGTSQPLLNINKGGGVSIDDEGVLIPGAGGGSALNPFGGIFDDQVRSDVYDMRFRTFYSFLNPSKGFSQDFRIGGRLANQGGIGLHFEVFEGIQWSMVLRALEKSQKGTVVSAPRVTAFNTQRAHVLVADQQAYIKDFDVEIATNSVAYDPIVGVVQSGLVLDVRPIISNDRKYITLELRPAVANLVQPIRTTIVAQTFDIFGILHTVVIQLPELQIQRAQTTVRLPDRGTVIIAGLKNVLDRDLQAETPFLAKIPLLSFLFSRKAKTDEKQNLVILVTAEIIDLAEREDKL